MVKLEFSGICEGCKVADLELEKSADNSWEVGCTHKEACERIKKQFIPSDPHKRFALDLRAME